MKRKVAPTKSTTKAYVSFCFFLSAVLLPALYRFPYRQWNKRNYSTPFECVRSRAASCNKRREFWRETHTPLWLLIGRITFLTREKTSFAILIGRIIFFTCENHRSVLWLTRTNLRTKIYDIAFRWVFLSMYIIKFDLMFCSPLVSYLILIHAARYVRLNVCNGR